MAWPLLLGVSAASAAYTPPGLLADLVELKQREVARMKKLPEAREDGPWALRLAYPAAESSYHLGRALGWRRETPVVLVDLKRSSPGDQLGATVSVDPSMQVEAALSRAEAIGVAAALVCTDLPSYGCTWEDLRAARTWAASRRGGGAAPLPLIAKDLFIDPLQIARAACEGADAVLLVAAACLADLSALLDTCTLVGVEALVEVHTPEELCVATELGASLVLVTERDRATGQLVSGQAAALAPAIPPDVVCLACGDIRRLDQVRTLRRAGFDGVVIGRMFGSLEGPLFAEQLMKEEPWQRVAEMVQVPRTAFDGEAEGGTPVSDESTL
ncbi:hypothetical protein AB1Y20_005010 [Prymnesium parvum]|uniref:indole-3-glycerol-phosphate synthase n=1 Tax=Prymnesium parvum TaxID=97485 RepID=A0AB34J2Z8_PRYPA